MHAWDHLPYIERFIFNKLIGGGFRIDISTQSLINAIAKKYSLEPSAVAHSIMGSWDVNKVRFAELIRGAYTNTEASKPYPFCLAYALDNKLDTLGAPSEWQVEYKWDGIRGQFIKRNSEVFIWSRGEELVTDQFPEIKNCLASWPENIVFDGEILAYKDNRVLHFSELQKRLNRKQVSAQLMKEVPIAVFAYDLIEWSFEDVRNKPLSQRRKLLEQLILNHANDSIYLSPIFSFTGWREAEELRSNAERMHAEGIMLKHKNGIYHTGRKKGDWWKWKIDPQTIDAVLIYAQKGSGRRSGYYTDYTFAVKHNDQLVPIAKAYSGLTDKEIQEVSNFINKNALEKFGPVRTVKPELVFEIAFEGISFSKRHKSGVALRS